jgi:hypothetical protein
MLHQPRRLYKIALTNLAKNIYEAEESGAEIDEIENYYCNANLPATLQKALKRGVRIYRSIVFPMVLIRYILGCDESKIRKFQENAMDFEEDEDDEDSEEDEAEQQQRKRRRMRERQE